MSESVWKSIPPFTSCKGGEALPFARAFAILSSRIKHESMAGGHRVARQVPEPLPVGRKQGGIQAPFLL